MKVNPQVVLELKARGLSNYKIAELLDVHEKTIRRILDVAGHKPWIVPEGLEAFQFTIDEPIVLRDEDAMVTADWHSPLINPSLFNEMMDKAVEQNIKTLIIAGDLFNMDSLSAYDPKQAEAGLEREVDVTKTFIRTACEWFDKVVIIWGNHDARLHRALGYKAQFASAMRWLFGDLGPDIDSKIHLSNLDHLWVEFTDVPAPRQKWYICHPQSYSRIPLSTPRTLAAKYNANVICAHAHHAAVGFATDGLKVCAEIGGLFNQHVTAYLQRSTSFPTWTPGYGWFKDGQFYLTTPAWRIV